MPQPSSSKHRNVQRYGGGTNSSRHKGITMEDLKKQTARRLAQEQQQNQESPYNLRSSRDQPFQPLDDYQVAGGGHAVYIQPQGSLDVLHPIVNNETLRLQSITPHGGQPNTPRSISHVQQISAEDDYQGNRLNTGQFENTQSGHRTSHLMTMHLSDPTTDRFQRQGYRALDSSFVSLSQGQLRVPPSKVSGNSKLKLPHGLTVHELKEMTKARLQAEATEKPEPESQKDSSFESRRMSPLDFDPMPEVRDRAASRDSGRNNFLLHGSDSMNSIPSLVHVNKQARELVPGRQQQVSPLPPGLQMSGVSSAIASQQHHLKKAELWENSSMASHNSAVLSDKGSESVYSGGLGTSFLPLADSDTSYSRVRSFSAVQPGSTYEDASFSSVHASPAIGGNRRRAVTLSPRAGSIHEDRPILDTDELRIPNFASPGMGKLTSRPSRSSYAPVLELGVDSSLIGQQAGLAPLRGMNLNRPRTSSAASSPLISQDVNDFNRDRANTFNGFPTGEEVVPRALTDNFLNVSQIEKNIGTANPSLAVPPGFSSNASSAGPASRLHMSTLSRDIGRTGETRVPSVPSMFSSESDINYLADGMGSILQLSGADSNRSRPEKSNCDSFGIF